MFKVTIYISIIVATLFMSGCSSTKIKTKWESRKKITNYSQSNNPTEFRYKPVIGTKQSDTKVMIDMGEWAKIWIKNYKNKNKTFVASHSIVTMIREPGFIAGEQIPYGRRQSVYDTYGARSFTFRSSDLIHNNSSQGSNNVSDEEIKNYVNNYEYSKKTKKVPPQKREEITKYNASISKYIKERKEKERKKKSKEIVASNDVIYNNNEEYKKGSLK